MIKWFEITFGWFFINGMKQENWDNYLKQKYNLPYEDKKSSANY